MTGSGRTALVVRRTSTDGRPYVALGVIAQESGLHPDLVHRYVALGVIESSGGTTSEPLFDHAVVAQLMRLARLRRDLGVNLAGAALADQLLRRIELLEDRLAAAEAARRQG